MFIVYDGQCRLCQWSVRRVQSRDRRGQFQYLALQTPGLEDRFPALRGADLGTGLRLVLPDGRVRAGADAVYEIYRRLPPWHLLAWLYRVPLLRALLRAAYALVARYRYRVFGRVACDTGVCAVPQAPPAQPRKPPPN